MIGECESALAACLRIRRRPLAPRAVLYAEPEAALVPAAAIAGADGIGDRSLPMHDLLSTIRTVAGGAPALPPVAARWRVAAAALLDAADHPIFAMRLAGTASAEIAATLGISRSELSERTAEIVARLARPQPRQEPRRRTSTAAMRKGADRRSTLAPHRDEFPWMARSQWHDIDTGGAQWEKCTYTSS